MSILRPAYFALRAAIRLSIQCSRFPVALRCMGADGGRGYLMSQPGDSSANVFIDASWAGGGVLGPRVDYPAGLKGAQEWRVCCHD